MPNQNVEERIVEMRIDNGKFESGAKRTIGILEKLEKALNFNGNVDPFASMSRSMERFDSSPMERGLDAISVKMNALDVAAMRVVQNLTDGVYNAAVKTAKALSIDQISAGWDKYEKLTESTQAIMAATRENVGINVEDGWLVDENGSIWDAEHKNLKGFIDEASQMDAINTRLEKLLWYTDETSYNFTDMAANVGKFLSNGTDLDKTFTAISGIATWGASAGAKAQQVSNAMNNISQAIGSGQMMAIDWRSIENAGMATADFKRHVLEVANEMGILTEVMQGNDEESRAFIANLNKDRVNSAGYIQNLTDEEVDRLITIDKFRDSLSSKWFSKDLMMGVFEKYGAFSDLLNETFNKTGIEATDLLQILDQYRKVKVDPENYTIDWAKYADGTDATAEELEQMIKALDELGIEYSETGFRMGQEAKTWSDAKDATKDAVSSKWMKSFQYIFGDYLQAKDFWTDVTSELYDIFAAGGDVRNDILEAWSQVDEDGLTGRDYLLAKTDEFQGVFWDILDVIHSVTDPIKSAFAEIFGTDTSENIQNTGHMLRDFTKRLKDFVSQFQLTEKAQDGLKNVFKGIFSLVKGAMKIFGGVISYAGRVVAAIGNVVDFIMAMMSGNPDSLTRHFAPFILVEKLKTLVQTLLPTSEGIKTVFKNVGKAIFNMIPSEADFIRAFGFVKAGAQYIWDSILRYFSGKSLSDFIPSSEQISNLLAQIGTAIEEKFPTLSEKVKKLSESSLLVGVVTNLSKIIEDFYAFIGNVFRGTDSVAKKFASIFSKLFTKIQESIEKLRGSSEDSSGETSPILTMIQNLLSYLGNLNFTDIAKIFGSAGLAGIILQLFETIRMIKNFADEASDIPKQISGVFENTANAIKGFGIKLKADAFTKFATAMLMIAGALLIISLIPEEKLMQCTSVIIAITLAIGLISKVTANIKQSNELSKNATSILKLAAGIVLIALAVLIISGAISKLSKSAENGKMTTALLVLTAIMASLVAVVAALVLYANAISGKGKKTNTLAKAIIKMAEAMILIAIAIRVLMPAIKNIVALDSEGGNVYKAVLVISLIMLALVAVVGILDLYSNNAPEGESSKDMAKSITKLAVSMILISAAVRILIPALQTICDLYASGAPVLKAVIILAVLMLSITAMIGIMSGILQSSSENGGNSQSAVNGILKLAASMILIGIAVQLLMASVQVMAAAFSDSESASAMVKGLITLGIIIVSLGVIMGLLSKFTSGGNLLLIAAGFLVLAVALNLLIPALSALAGLALIAIKATASIEDLGSKLLKLAGLAALVAAFAVVLILLAGGMLLLSITLGLLAVSLPLFVDTLAKTSENIGNIKIGRLLLFAAAIVGIGWAVSKLIGVFKRNNEVKEGTKSLANSLIGGLGAIISRLGTTIINALPIIMKLLGSGLILIGLYMLEYIGPLASLMARAVVGILEAIYQLLSANKGAIEHAVFGIIETILEVAVDAVTWAINTIIQLVMGLIRGAIASIFGEDNAVIRWFDTASKDLTEAGNTIAGSINDAMRSALPEASEWKDVTLVGAGGVLDGLSESKDQIMAQMGADAKELSDSMKSAEVVEQFKEAGSAMTSGTATGANTAANEQMPLVGDNIVSGLISGIMSGGNSELLQGAGGWMSGEVETGFVNHSEIHSPSRLFARLGAYIPAGLGVGIENNAGAAVDSIVTVSDLMYAAVEAVMAKVGVLADDDFAISPRITPVVDMSNVDSASGYMNGAFEQNYSVSAQMSSSLNRRMADVERAASDMNSRGDQIYNGDVVTVNVYPAQGQSPEEIADAVITKISNRTMRRGVAFG